MATILSACLISSTLAAVTSETAGSDCLMKEISELGKPKEGYANTLDHIADDAVCFPWSRVFVGLSISEDLQSAESLVINQGTMLKREGNPRISLNAV